MKHSTAEGYGARARTGAAALALAAALAGCSLTANDAVTLRPRHTLDGAVTSDAATADAPPRSDVPSTDAPTDAASEDADDGAADAVDAIEDVVSSPSDANDASPDASFDASFDAPIDTPGDTPGDAPDDAADSRGAFDDASDASDASDATDVVAVTDVSTVADARPFDALVPECSNDAECTARRAHAAGRCGGGRCEYTCEELYGDCDGLAANGCEASLATDVHNCLSCGTVCPGTYTPTERPFCGRFTGCTRYVCGGGYLDCNLDPADLCEVNTNTDRANCGRCGNACAAGFECRDGRCQCPADQFMCGERCLARAAARDVCGSCAPDPCAGERRTLLGHVLDATCRPAGLRGTPCCAVELLGIISLQCI